jgi:hypothetical protein
MIESVVEVVIVCAAYFVGTRSGRTKRVESPKESKEPKPVCGCKHHYSHHDPDTSACNAQWSENVLVERGEPKQVLDFSDGFRQEYSTVYSHERFEGRTYSCACKRYTGPEPLPRYVT